MAKKKTTKKQPRGILAFQTLLKSKQLHAWQIGMVLSVYNSVILLALAILAFVSVLVIPVWWYVIVVSPIFFAIFWMWFSQKILEHYHMIPWDEALIVAKAAMLPFLVLFVGSLVVMAITIMDHGSMDATVEGILSYYGIVMSSGTIFLGYSVLTFGLTHHISIRSVLK